ncbi:MAG TPA: hypothetical protein VIL35_12320, partial [Vicinamibacterales bacterium]
AVQYYTRAVQDDPDRPEYKIALERAMQAAANAHMDKARAFEANGELESAIVEYRRALELSPGNSQAIQKRAALERQLREQMEANRPPSKLDAMRERARRQTEAPLLSPTSKEPIELRGFTNVAIADILKFLSDTTGINILIEQQAQQVVSRPMTLNVSGVTLEQALNLIMTANQLWYKVMNERTILVIQDTPQKRQQYEDQVLRTFYISHADPQELFNLVNQVARIPGVPIQPTVSINKSANTITVRSTPNIVNILEKVIQANDRPRAEIVIDVEMLEVNRNRAKELGLNLSQYTVGTIFSPEQPPAGAPPGGDDDDGDDGPATDSSTFNLNTITRGISTADFYLTVPQAIVNFLASDTRTRLLAKPQLRGAEGTDLELNLGEEVPVPQTVFGGFAAGGVNTVPIQSFNYRNVGVNVKMNPRVTFDNEIILTIEIENSTLGSNLVVAGQSLPTFGTRKVKTRMRLREGESHLLAGLIREEDRRTLRGIPGLLRVPILKDIFGGTDEQIAQTDIVMLLTPRIVRTHELTQEHLDPIYIGSQLNLGLTTPPPSINVPEPEPAQPVEPGPGVPPAPNVPPIGAVPPGYTPPVGGSVTTPGAQQPGASPPIGTTTPPAGPPPAVGPGQLPSATSPQVQSPTSSPGLAPVGPQAAGEGGPTPTAQISVTTPGPEFTVGGGPYTVPISV